MGNSILLRYSMNSARVPMVINKIASIARPIRNPMKNGFFHQGDVGAGAHLVYDLIAAPKLTASLALSQVMHFNPVALYID